MRKSLFRYSDVEMSPERKRLGCGVTIGSVVMKGLMMEFCRRFEQSRGVKRGTVGSGDCTVLKIETEIIRF
jgi:hypothetical protein